MLVDTEAGALTCHTSGGALDVSVHVEFLHTYNIYHAVFEGMVPVFEVGATGSKLQITRKPSASETSVCPPYNPVQHKARGKAYKPPPKP
jgi:hypothetical protein